MKSLIQTETQFSGSVYIGDHVNDIHYLKGSIYIGDGGVSNYLAVSSSGYIKSYGIGRSYNTISYGFNQLTPSNDSELPVKTLYSGSMIWAYPNTDDAILYYTITLGNDYAEGTNILPFINIVTPIMGQDANINFLFTCAWQNSNSDVSSNTYFNDEFLCTIVGLANHINRYEFTSLNGTGKQIGSILLCSLKRFVTSGRNDDTFDYPIYLLNAGISYISDSNGSRGNFSK